MKDPVFITGASGFIGGQLARRFLADGRRVRVLTRRSLPELESLGAEVLLGDLESPASLYRGCLDVGTVFHVAGRVGVWGRREEFFQTNVEGTRNIIAASQTAGVRRLVYTSSPSVVYNGGDLAGMDESAPLCTEAPSAYPTSKAEAERLVAAANSRDFGTVALRPHLVWGPGDNNLVPRILALAARGRLQIVGHGRNKVDLTHIDNVVDAHVLAEQALENEAIVPFPKRTVGGRAYFITNGEPVVLWDWINELLRGLDRPVVTRRVSLGTAYAMGAVLETLWRVLPLLSEPPMTRFVAKELATDHWFSIAAARRDLGYAPKVTMAAGLATLVAHLRSSEATLASGGTR